MLFGPEEGGATRDERPAMPKRGIHMLVVLCCGGLIVIAIAVLSAMLAFGTKAPPPTLTSVSEPFNHVDFSDLPKIETIPSRGGGRIAFRQWRPSGPDPQDIVIAIHGSSGSSSGFHPLGKALSAQGIWFCAPDIRGHGETGQRGDIDYPGQLDDDLADLLAAVEVAHPKARPILLGFSSGGGFALHVAATPLAKSFARTILISPMLGVSAPTIRPDLRSWGVAYVPRIIAIVLLNRIGIHVFDHLPVLAFAIDPKQARYLTQYYSFLLMNAFGTADYAADLRNARLPMAVLVGERDELFDAEKFPPTIGAIRADVPATLIPGLSHVEMITDPRAVPAIVGAIRGTP
jgi:alpha-beta hydrolase superfamily lysophospholipase